MATEKNSVGEMKKPLTIFRVASSLACRINDVNSVEQAFKPAQSLEHGWKIDSLTALLISERQ
jgi:hypothetical protein